MPTETTLADEQITKVSEIVYGKLATVTEWAASASEAAQSAIDSIGLLDVPNIEIQFPQAPVIKEPVSPSLTSVPDYVISNSPQSVTFTPTEQIELTAPTVIPSPVYGAPALIIERPDSALPLPPTSYPVLPTTDVPALPLVAVPVAPKIQLPDAPALLSIKVTDAPQTDIQAFDDKNAPSSDDVLRKVELLIDRGQKAISLVNSRNAKAKTEWKLAEKRNVGRAFLEVLDEPELPEKNLVHKDSLHQKNKMPTALREYYSAVAASDTAVLKKRAELTSAWASRNFSMPPGMLIGDINELEIEAANSLRDKAIEINEMRTKLMLEEYFKIWEMFASMEENFVALYTQSLRQSVENEKLRVRTQIELFNASVSLYNSKLDGVRAYIDAYNAELDAALNVDGSYSTAVDAAVAAMSENTARVGIYSQQARVAKLQADTKVTAVQALTAPLELYKAQLTGVKANADTAVANIESYREAVRAYAAAVETTSAEVEAYAAQVAAAGSGAAVAETNAKAYAAYAEAAAKNNVVFKTFVTEQGEVLSANLQTFRDAGSTNESFLRAQAARISGQTEVTGARVSAFDNYVRNFSSYNRALADKTAAAMNHSMTSAENVARAQALLNQATAEADKVKAGALAGKAAALAGLAQGAMSAMHVSASAQGSGSTGSSYGYNRSWTVNWGGTTRESESKVQRLSGA